MLEHLIPLRRLLDAGLRVGCGTDWGPKNVFEHLALAVEPTYAGTDAKTPTPGISRREALAMWTREAARVLRWEDIGSLEPGSWADLVVVDRNPLACPVEDMPATEVRTVRRPCRSPPDRPCQGRHHASPRISVVQVSRESSESAPAGEYDGAKYGSADAVTGAIAARPSAPPAAMCHWVMPT
ncbi:amidohydrolase family protein [Streptomyces chartreusis]|uniref:Amidohydrolase family protein n=1 Tax=Streptomyces chartreusis TaxID=1969 RepID=A0A7H8T291_STRCX|nr:amidohydrolase family protein [Streptomyces chartreusis]